MPVEQRPTLIVACVFCNYRARHTDDTEPAVRSFLRARLIAHCQARHCLAELRAALVHVPAQWIPFWRDLLADAGTCTHDRPCEGEPRPTA
jgi:hypothetical protein